MLVQKLSALQELVDTLTKEVQRNSVMLPILQKLQESVMETAEETAEETVSETVQEIAGEEWISMPFLHNMTPDIRAKWNLADFDPAGPNDVPNQNLKVMALILATNIESTVGKYAWSLVEYSLGRLGFTNIMHHYFEAAERIDHPAMAFGRSVETVNGKTVVAAVFREALLSWILSRMRRRNRADSLKPGSTPQMNCGPTASLRD